MEREGRNVERKEVEWLVRPAVVRERSSLVNRGRIGGEPERDAGWERAMRT